MRNRLLAWFNLAYRFNRHVLTRVPLRALRAGADFERFVGAVAPEGYLPLLPAERALVPAAMRCVHCGLCAFAPPAGEADVAAGAADDDGGAPAEAASPPRYSAWADPWTFVGGPSRSVDRAALVATGSLPGEAADRLCPTGVPISRLAAMHRRLAHADTPVAPTTAAAAAAEQA